MILISNLFKDGNAERYDEYMYCVKRNLENKSFDKFVLFVNDDFRYTPSHDKIEYVEMAKNPRPYFVDYFNYVSQKYKDEIIVITNLDIFFDETIEFARKMDLNKFAVALLRWNFKGDGSVKLEDSPSAMPGHTQDSWIFKLPKNFSDMWLDFPLGFPGSDGQMAGELKKKYQVINCPWNIKSYHYHTTKLRRYTSKDHVGETRNHHHPVPIKL